jgi:hypothetical protein
MYELQTRLTKDNLPLEAWEILGIYDNRHDIKSDKEFLINNTGRLLARFGVFREYRITKKRTGVAESN